MSITSQLSSNPDKVYKKPLHRRNDSDELDVFEAAGYFSGYNETRYGNSLLNQKTYKEADNNNNKNVRKGGRMSLDLSLRRNIIEQEENPMKDEKIKNRQQPSSPGGRLASFLNSLFNQSSSKKKKIKSKNHSMAAPSKNQDHHEFLGGRRRRSSLSSLIDYSKTSSNSSSSSTSSTIQTPLKNYNTYKEMRSYLENKKKLQVSSKKMEVVDEDEGGESDSSSDLFELRIYDLDCYSSSSSGLPLYQTTKPSLPISTI